MPFGRNKGGDGADDGNRQALFGNRKGGGAPAGNNPYAQAPPSDPYAQPARGGPSSLGSGSRVVGGSGGGGGGGLPSGPRGGSGGLPSGPRAGGAGGLPGGPAPRRTGNPYGDDRGGDRYGGGGAGVGAGPGAGAGGGNPYGAPRSGGNPYGNMPEQGDRYGGGGRGGSGGPMPGNGYGGAGGGGNERSAGGYGANRYGGQSGYGGDRYGSGGAAVASRSGGGGYGGGAGRYGEQDDEQSRDALFGGAKDRYAQRQQQGGGEEGARSGGYGSGYGDQSYGSGGRQRDPDRQLTAEEQEEEDIQDTKDQIRSIKREDVSATRNALRIAQMAEETGRDTLERLGAQGERIHETEKNLDLAQNQNRLAEERAKELKTLNRSMFAVHVSNPFTSGRRARERDQDVLDKHLEERNRREETRREAFNSDQRMQRALGSLDHEEGPPRTKQSLAERAKYQFEADSEDEELENEIDANLDLLSGAASRLNKLARATGEEVDQQNRHLDRIMGKTDVVDVHLASNQARLDRFK